MVNVVGTPDNRMCFVVHANDPTVNCTEETLMASGVVTSEEEGLPNRGPLSENHSKIDSNY